MAYTITVTGATGNVGNVLARLLLDRGHTVRAVGRDARRLQPLVDQGAQAHVGDLVDTDFLTTAYRGADGVFAMVPPNPSHEDCARFTTTVSTSHARALRAAGVRFVVGLSSIGAHAERGHGVASDLHRFERDLQALEGVNVHILRAAYFMENTYAQIDIIRNLAMTAGPFAPDMEQPMVAARDVASVAADRLSALDFDGFSVAYVLGPRDVSYREITSTLAHELGYEDLYYLQVDDDDARVALAQLGWSRSFIDRVLEFSRGVNTGSVLEGHERTGENTTPTTFEEFARGLAERYRNG